MCYCCWIFLNTLNHCHLLKNASKSEHCALNASVLYLFFELVLGDEEVCVCVKGGRGEKM